jgi:hypothetical protein
MSILRLTYAFSALFWAHQKGVKQMTITIHETQETYGSDFYVYAGSELIRVCPSLSMAREVAAAYS